MNENPEQTAAGDVDLRRLTRTACVRAVAAFFFLCFLFFLPAGTLAYWQAWLYLATVFVPAVGVMTYLLKHDPELLDRRLRLREKEGAQKRIVAVSIIVFLVIFVIPGFDRRFGWSSVPAAVVVAADIAVLLGYLLFVLVLRENRYASRVIEVAKGQEVISTGPYAVVRHPMYLSVAVIYMSTPLALGSSWGMVACLLVPLFLAARILNEEKVLCRDLPGYGEYIQKIRYRLIPFVW
jgi:protein-S-isoprenylcysteine O-methyltransferase Ste14